MAYLMFHQATIRFLGGVFLLHARTRRKRGRRRTPTASGGSGTMTGPAAERPDSLYTVLDLIRGGVSRTRPELVGHSGLGRKVVTQRVEQLIACGLVEDGELGRSTGGRAPRQLRFRVDGG